MAEETPISSLDPLGPQYGGINRPTLDPQGFQPFEGDRIDMPQINFPEAKQYTPSSLGAESLNRPDNAIRSIVGTPPNKPKITKGNYTPGAMRDLIKAQVGANQDRNEYAKVYAYDASPSGNAFYKRYAAYGQETFDAIGFSPLRDNEALFNAGTTRMDDFSRMMTNSFLPLFGRGFVSGPKSLYRMFQGDFGSDPEDARMYEEAAAIGQSTKGGIFGFVNNTAMNFAYTAGIISEAILEEVALSALTAATFGGTAPILFASTANKFKQLAQAGKIASKLENGFDAAKAVNTTLDGLNNISGARKFWEAAKDVTGTSIGRFINPFENVAEAGYQIYKNEDNLTGLARLTAASAKTVGAFYRDVRAVNMALSEARLEGGFVENSVYDKLYNEFYERTGLAPDDKTQQEFRATAKEAGMETLKWNTALVYASNKIVIPNIIGPKGALNGGLGSRMKDIMNLKGGKIIFEQAKKASKKIAQGEFKFIEDSFMNTLKDFKRAPFRKAAAGFGGYFKANLMEGLQENAQEAIAGAYEKYYVHNALKNQGVASHQFNKGLESYLTEEMSANNPLGKGFETFASGFFMGFFGKAFDSSYRGLQLGYNKIFNREETQKYIEMRNNYGKGIADNLNRLNADPKQFFNSKVWNYGVQHEISGNKDNLTQKEAMDIHDESFMNAVYSALDTNTLNYFIDHIESGKDYSVEEFEEAFGFEKGTGAEYQGKIDGLVTRARDIQKRYKEINERFPTPPYLSSYEKDHPDYEAASLLSSAWEMSKRQAVFAQQSYNDIGQRMSSIMNTIANEPSLSKMSATDLQILFDMSKMNNEIGLLKDEIDSISQSTDPRSKIELEKKKKKVEALENFLEKYNSLRTYTGRKEQRENIRQKIAKEAGVDVSEVTDMDVDMVLDEVYGPESEENLIRRESELEGAFKSYLRVLADSNDSQLFDRDIDVAFNKLKDYYKLDGEAKQFAKHINILSDPQGFFEMVQRNNAWMSRLYNNRKEYFDQMVEAQIKAKEKNDLLNALANHDVYLDLDEFQAFLEKGVYPSQFYDGRGKVITQNNPRYDNYINILIAFQEIQESSQKDLGTQLDEEAQAKVDELVKKMNSEIEALEKSERRENLQVLEAESGKTLSLKDVVEKMQNNTYAELKYGENEYITYYKDAEGVLKFDNDEGEEVNIKRDNTKYAQGVIYKFSLLPDPTEVQKIRDKYEALIADVYEEAANKKASFREEFVPITQDTPLSQMPEELVTSLRNAFQTEVLAIMDEDTQASMDDQQIMDLFANFIATEPSAARIIDDYNVKKRAEFATRQLGEKEEFTFEFGGQKINTADLDVPSIRRYIKKYTEIKNEFESRSDLTQDEKIRLNSSKIMINDLEAIIRTRGKKGLSPKLLEALNKLEALSAAQQSIELTKQGYLINGVLHKRVSNIVKDFKSKGYEYVAMDRVKLNFFKFSNAVDPKTNEPYFPGDTIILDDTSIAKYLEALKAESLPGFSTFTYDEIKNSLDTLKNKLLTKDKVLETITAQVLEKTYEENRIAGNYIDEQLKNLFAGIPVSKIYSKTGKVAISDEAFESLFSEEIDEKTNLPKGSLARLRNRVDTGELVILSKGLTVYDSELQIAGEIDLIVADQKGNISIIDLKTGSEDKWGGWRGTTLYNERINSTDPAIRQKAEFADSKAEDYELQQTAYANLLYRMTGIDARIGILPVEVKFQPETGFIIEARKPKIGPLISRDTLPLSKDSVKEKIDAIIPKVYVAAEEEVAAGNAQSMKVATAISDNARKKLNRLGINDSMIDLMTKEEIEESLTYNTPEEAKAIIDKYKDLAREAEVTDDVPVVAKNSTNQRNINNIQRRINILSNRRDKVAEDVYVLDNTLEYLNNILNSSKEYSQATVQDILDKIAQLETIVSAHYKSNSSKKTKRGQSTAAMIDTLKKQIKDEFRVSQDILNRINELKYELDSLNAIKADLTNQINYYNNLIADPAMGELGRKDVEDKINKIEKKLNTIEKLIKSLGEAIKKSIAYINEYLKLWKKADNNYRQFITDTGYKPLSRERIAELIKSTDPEDAALLANYPELTAQVEALQNEVLSSMDNVELVEEAKAGEQRRQEELLKAYKKYNDQIRYLRQLLEPMDVSGIEEPISDVQKDGPKATNTAAQTQNITTRLSDLQDQIDDETQADLEGEVVSSLSFGYTFDSIKKRIEQLKNLDEFTALRAELNGQFLLGNISQDMVPQISALLEQKKKDFTVDISTDQQIISIKTGDQVIAKIDIFKNNILFAPGGATLSVIKIDSNKKIVTLKYNSKMFALPFDELDNMIQPMVGVPTTKEAPVQEVSEENKAKVAESTDVAEAFIKNGAEVDAAVAEADKMTTDEAKNNLMNNLKC